MADIETRPRAVGDAVWLARSGGWGKAKVVAASGSEYWLLSLGDPFCPGDSGASAWGAESGRPVWSGMVVSGGSPEGCSPMAAAIKPQAIEWEWSR